MEPVWDMPTKPLTTKPNPRSEPRTAAVPASRGIWLAYERFLELPVTLVLLIIWVVGVTLLGACALLTYEGISALARMVTEAF
jgi:hypothetical protein